MLRCGAHAAPQLPHRSTRPSLPTGAGAKNFVCAGAPRSSPNDVEILKHPYFCFALPLDFPAELCIVVRENGESATGITMDEGFVEVSATLRAGVYVLVHHDEVVYVGKSKVMLGRIYTHRVAWGSKRRTRRTDAIPPKGILFNRVFVHPCRLDEVDALEQSLIAKYHPRYNTQHKSGMPPELQVLISNNTAQAPSQPRIPRRGW